MHVRILRLGTWFKDFIRVEHDELDEALTANIQIDVNGMN